VGRGKRRTRQGEGEVVEKNERRRGMKTKKRKGGFTLVELLVAMVILVIVFGLVTYLYTRAAKVRKIVVVNNEIQQVLSQVMDTLTYGDKAHWGIVHATGITSGNSSEMTISRFDPTTGSPSTATIQINPSTNPGTVTVQWNSENPVVLDPAGKVEILTESRFEYYDSGGNTTGDMTKVSFIKIVLWARSRDPVMRSANPVPLVTGVKLRNKSSF